MDINKRCEYKSLLEVQGKRLKELDEKLNLIQDIIGRNFGILLNANDTFMTACADCVTLDYQDFDWALPIIQKYGIDGELAVMSIITKQSVLPQLMNDNIKNAILEIKKMDVVIHSEY